MSSNDAKTQDSIVLCAFLREDGLYNVWRYDTPTTECVAFGMNANSRQDAEDKSRALLQRITQSSTVSEQVKNEAL